MNLRKTSKQNKEWKRKRPRQPDIRKKPFLFNGRRKKKNQPSRADNVRTAFLIDCSKAGTESEPKKKAFKQG